MRKILASLLITLFLAGCADERAPLEEAGCETRTADLVAQHSEAQMDFYRQYGGRLPITQNRTTFYPGTNGRAVVLVHGFISAPDSMADLARALQAEGYSVIAPLITGFGDGAEAANTATLEDWRASVRTAISDAKHCHQDVSLVAHSLGSALVTMAAVDAAEGEISHIVLLAPYYKAYATWLKYLGDLVALGTDTLELSAAEKYLGLDPYEYFSLDRPAPGEPDAYIPLHAMRRVLELEPIFTEQVNTKLKVPALAFLSKADLVVDSEFAAGYLPNRFEQVETVVYEENEGIEHGLHRRDRNPRFEEMAAKILDHLR
jgi:alpha-beta hydrolase superfamily lysophospholipase